MDRKALVIGAGFSGISSATALASAGFRVDVFEKGGVPGGRAQKLTGDGFTFDMGPSWYWMPDVIEDYFNHFGKSASDYYQLKRLDPGYRMFFSPGDHIDVPADREELYSLFEQIEPGSQKKLKKFLDQAEYKYLMGMKKFVYLPGHSVFELLHPGLLRGLLSMDVFRSVASVVRKNFRDERLRRMLEFPVIFLGATASEIPAIYTLMNYADLVLGSWYPLGGMSRVVDGMVELAGSFGVEFHYHSEVTRILISGNQVDAVEVNHGKQYTPDVVVASADYHHVEQYLLPPEARNYPAGYWKSRKMAPSALLFYLGVNRKLNLFHHNLFFDTDFQAHAEQIYKDPKWPDDPAMYISCTSRTERGVAPEGMENVVVLIPVAPGLQDDENIREKYYTRVIRKLEEMTGQPVGKHIVFKKTIAQSDFIDYFHAYRGNAYGLANTLFQTASMKPKIRNRKIKNLFYTGQLTVPGPGVPPCLVSGLVVAGQIMKNPRWI